MMNCKQICNEICSDMQERIETAITFREDWVTYEKKYGTAVVVIETGYERKNGWMFLDTQVEVLHDDDTHKSPLLKEAIEKTLPSWVEIEQQMDFLQ